MWASGNLTYGGSIFAANLVLLYKFNLVDGYNILIIGSGLASFFIASLIEDEMVSIPDLYKVFDNLFSEAIAWVALMFIIGLVSVIELSYRAITH